MKASGKFVLRISPQFHERLKSESSKLGISLNQYCRSILERIPRTRRRAGESTTDCDIIRLAKKRFSENLVGILLWGSVARGSSIEGSDIDCLVILESTIPLTRELYRAWEAAAKGIDADVHFAHLPADSDDPGAVWLEVAVDGVVLFEKDLALSRLLSRIRRNIASGGWHRRSVHGQPYWVRRPMGAE